MRVRQTRGGEKMKLPATLVVQAGRNNRRSFFVSYTNSKGKLVPKGVLTPAAQAFNKQTVADGDPAEIELNATGQIIRCTVPGKPGEPEEVRYAAPPRAAGTYQSNNRGGSNYNRPDQKQGGGAAGFATSGVKVPPATAAYNFVPYEPEAVLPAFQLNERPAWSGKITVRLDALTPLMVSGKQTQTAPGAPTECKFMEIDGKPVISGTSIKGMLRSLVEILSFSRMEPVSRKKLFWRNVNRPNYIDAMRDPANPDRIFGGYLRKHGAQYSLAVTQVSETPDRGKKVPMDEKTGYVPTGHFTYRDKKTKELKLSTAYQFGTVPQGHPVELQNEVITTFNQQMTPNQEGRFKADLLKKDPGHPIFFRPEAGEIAEIGMCRFFRRPYTYSPGTLPYLQDATREPDFTTILFGTTQDKSRRGKVSVSACEVQGKKDEKCQVVLGGPKPTCLAHYLDQTGRKIKTLRTRQGEMPKYDREDMANYNEDSRLRGRKLYWHREKEIPEIPEGISQKVRSNLNPMARGSSAEFTIHVDGLTDLELGCLLMAIELPEGHAHKLGMGKALGFGSVRLEIIEAAVEDTGSRYASLADRLSGSGPSPLSARERESLKQKFKAEVFKNIAARYAPWAKYCEYENLPPIEALRIMMDFANKPDPAKIKNMPLDRFKCNHILQTPQEIVGKK